MNDFQYRVKNAFMLASDEPVIENKHIVLNFEAQELACRHCGLICLAPGFGERLAVLRLDYGKPMKLSSACRCREHNLNEGGHPNSAHLCDIITAHNAYGCCGVDVLNPDMDLITKALETGWSVGLSYVAGKIQFAHLDRIADYSELKNYQRLFFYDNAPDDQMTLWNERFVEILNLKEPLKYLYQQ